MSKPVSRVRPFSLAAQPTLTCGERWGLSNCLAESRTNAMQYAPLAHVKYTLPCNAVRVDVIASAKF